MHGVVWFARFTGKLFHFHYYRRLCIPFGLRLMFVNQTAPSPCVTDTLWTEEGISWGVVASPSAHHHGRCCAMPCFVWLVMPLSCLFPLAKDGGLGQEATTITHPLIIKVLL